MKRTVREYSTEEDEPSSKVYRAAERTVTLLSQKLLAQRGSSICEAAENGNTKLIAMILEHSTPEQILPAYLKHATDLAQQHGHSELSQKLEAAWQQSRQLKCGLFFAN